MKKIKTQPSDPENALKHPAVIRLLSFSLLCGVLLCCGFAPVNAWFAAIFMPAIVFKIWQRLPSRWVFFSGFLFGAGLYLAGLSWIYQSIAHFSQASTLASLSLTLLFIIYFALYYGFLALGVRYVINSKSNWQILLVWPSLWVLMEWCFGHLFTGLPWLLIGYTQITSPLHVFAPIVGVYGLSFITIFMAAILVILTKQSELKKYYKTWGILAIVVLLSLMAKHVTWTKALPITQTVSLVQPQLEPTLKWLPSTLPSIESTYLSLTKLYWQTSDLIIWPEGALPVVPDAIKPWLTSLQEKINQNHTHLITGIITSDQANHYYNSALLLSPHASPQEFRKIHLVPFGEYFPFKSIFGFLYRDFQVPMSDLSEGEPNQNLLTYDTWRIAPSICYEIAFPDAMMRTMQDANLLVVISDDSWFGHELASFQHLAIAQMRALETGRYLIFADDTGPSAIIRPDGTLEKSTEQKSIVVLTGTVGQMTGITPFMRFGSWPVILLSIATLLLAIFYNQVYCRKDKIQ
jgi:apolipoprotein N-acyltransferase